MPEYDLFAGHSGITRAVIVSGGPPALVLPAALERAREPVQAFHIARALTLLSRQVHPIDHLDDVAMARILSAAVRQ